MRKTYARFTQFYPGIQPIYEPLLDNFYDILTRENKFNKTPFIFVERGTTFINAASKVQSHLKYFLKRQEIAVFATEGDHLKHCLVEHENGGWAHLYTPAPKTIVMTRTWLDGRGHTNRVLVALDELPDMNNSFMVAVNNSSFYPTRDVFDRLASKDVTGFIQTISSGNRVNIQLK